MKARTTSILKLLVALGLLPLVVAGCARTLCVKTVDASTGLPLSGASTSWQQSYHGYFHIEHEGPTNPPPSGVDGVIKIGEVHRNWSSSFIFGCPGYENIYGEFTSKGKMILANTIEYFPSDRFPGEFYLKGRMTPASLSNGCFVVPLPKYPKGDK